jgi:hypothetical protein
MAVMLVNAPYDFALATEYLSAAYGQKIPPEEARRVYGPRLDYDVKAIRALLQYVSDTDERVALLQKSCGLSPRDCLGLGWELARTGRDEEAAASYERGFDDPSLDAVVLASASEWLVNYYYSRGQEGAALKLAHRSFETGSFQGLVTAGHLLERMRRFDIAEDAYKRSADGYDNPSQLLGFYYRAVHVRKDAKYERAWTEALAPVFPNGLIPEPTDNARPEHGVIVMADNAKARTGGLQTGDIIVGLEGWRVDNNRQYQAINAFYGNEEIKLTAWRGALTHLTFTAKNRLIGIGLRSYPIEGWSER